MRFIAKYKYTTLAVAAILLIANGLQIQERFPEDPWNYVGWNVELAGTIICLWFVARFVVWCLEG